MIHKEQLSSMFLHLAYSYKSRIDPQGEMISNELLQHWDTKVSTANSNSWRLDCATVGISTGLFLCSCCQHQLVD